MDQVLNIVPKTTQGSATSVLDRFVEECVKENKEAVQQALVNMSDVSPAYIIESFTFKIISLAFSQKSKDQIVEDISGGVIFSLRDHLIQAFNEELNKSIKK